MEVTLPFVLTTATILFCTILPEAFAQLLAGAETHFMEVMQL
jgi:hypothetical protein